MLTLFQLRRSVLGFALFAAVPALLTPSASYGQSQSINGTIRGQVTDASGAAIPDAEVSVSNAELGYTKKIASSGDGYYVLVNLPLGTYTVIVSKSGFSSARYENVSLSAGKEIVLDSPLKVGNASEQIDVSASISTVGSPGPPGADGSSWNERCTTVTSSRCSKSARARSKRRLPR